MSEYIKREDAINALYEECNKDQSLSCPNQFFDGIARIPAADVREVVYCRDCKWTKTDGMDDPAIYCEKWDKWEVPNDGFCWNGRRR